MAEDGVAIDAPVAVSSYGLDDVESVRPTISGVMADPDVALVLDFYPYTVAGAYGGAATSQQVVYEMTTSRSDSI
jgi:hypothetical protein